MIFSTSRTGRVVLCLAFVLPLFSARTAFADTLTLMWDPNPQAVTGYVVYSGTQAGSLTQRKDVGNTTSYTLGSAVAGQQYCFAVTAYFTPGAEGPKSPTVCGYSDAFPTLTNPGNKTSTRGQAVSLQLSGRDPDGLPITYRATGLPPGLTLMAATGLIAGTPTTAGTYTVSASVFDGALSSTSQTFTWSITTSASSDTTPPSIGITGPTSASSYTSNDSSMSVSGTASDNVGVTAVTWANDRGGSGTATGTTYWSVKSIGLQAGANNITVTARDAAGNQRKDVLTVTFQTADATPPAISITTPTSAATFASGSATIALKGSAADNVGVTQVTWVNDRQGSGTATGTTSWSVPVVALLTGTNNITVTARDGVGNRTSDVVTVTYGVTADTTAPTIAIVGPTSASTYTTSSSVVTLGGTASDNRGVTAVTWSNSRGGSGFSSGTTSWSVPSITLQSGTNIITVQAQDAAGNKATDVLTVTYSAPALTLSGSWATKFSRVALFWSAVAGSTVDVYRNGAMVVRTANDGSHVDSPTGEWNYSYRVCLTGTSICSSTVWVRR